nr:hypothetical protein Iba_chr05aCG12530 [Ipomoea batatas]
MLGATQTAIDPAPPEGEPKTLLEVRTLELPSSPPPLRQRRHDRVGELGEEIWAWEPLTFRPCFLRRFAFPLSVLFLFAIVSLCFLKISQKPYWCRDSLKQSWLFFSVDGSFDSVLQVFRFFGGLSITSTVRLFSWRRKTSVSVPESGSQPPLPPIKTEDLKEDKEETNPRVMLPPPQKAPVRAADGDHPHNIQQSSAVPRAWDDPFGSEMSERRREDRWTMGTAVRFSG